MLAPETGRIVGWAAPTGGRGGARPALVEISLDGAPLRALLAAAPIEALGPAGIAALGAPPTADCAFSARLPRAAAGAALIVSIAGRAVFTHQFADDRALARYREGSDMADLFSLEGLRLQNGAFRAIVVGPALGAPPKITLRLRGEDIAAATLTPKGEGRWALTGALPASAYSDGVVVIEFVAVADGRDGATLAAYPLAAGAALAGDLVAEVASLRAELDHLKRAFRAAMAGGVVARDERPMIVAEALAEVDALLELRDRAERAAARDEAAADWEDEPSWDIRE